jgi:hypothetical protein
MMPELGDGRSLGILASVAGQTIRFHLCKTRVKEQRSKLSGRCEGPKNRMMPELGDGRSLGTITGGCGWSDDPISLV